MTDDQDDSVNEGRPDSAPLGGGETSPNGAGKGKPAPKALGVRSGLAEKRRNPALVAMGNLWGGTRRLIFKDPLNTFLFFAAIGLAVTFALLLHSIGPSSYGTQIPLSRAESLVAHRDVATAVLLDHDSRFELTTRAQEGLAPQALWTSYPSSGAVTQSLVTALSKSGANVIVDQQSFKATAHDHRPVPDPDPAARYPVRAADTHRHGRGRRRDRGFLGVHRKGEAQGQGDPRQRDLRRCGRCGRGGRRASRDP